MGGAGKDTATHYQGRCPEARKQLHESLQRLGPAFQHAGEHFGSLVQQKDMSARLFQNRCTVLRDMH
jgi:hypothetical protein